MENKNQFTVPKYIWAKPLILAILVFIAVHLACQLLIPKFSFPNWPMMFGIAQTSLSNSLIAELGLSYETATRLDPTNPTPRGIIAFILAGVTYLSSKNRRMRKAIALNKEK